MRIRPVEPRDFDAIAAITNHYIRETAIHFGEEPVHGDELRAAWEEAGARYPYLVAEEAPPDGDARVLGYAKAGPWRTRSAYRHTAETGIYVDHRTRGRGIGRALYRALVDACRDAGFHVLVGGITMPNDASVRLHESCGFEPVGVFRQVGFKFGAWHDVGWWQLVLVPGGGSAGARGAAP